jgi:hypothetical protein
MSSRTLNANTGTPPKQQVSPRQLAANQANAQKCTGPKTQAGKEIARFNSLQHGLTAKQVCLPGESREEFNQRRQEYAKIFQPANLAEWDILDDLVTARRRKDRAIQYERCLLLDTFMRRRLDLEKDYEAISLDAEAALAFRELCEDSSTLKLLDRYETRVMNNILADWKLLHQAIQNRPPDSGHPERATEALPPDLPNETIPANEHPELPDLEPIGNATRVGTIVPRSRTAAPAPLQPAATVDVAGPAFDSEIAKCAPST